MGLCYQISTFNENRMFFEKWRQEIPSYGPRHWNLVETTYVLVDLSFAENDTCTRLIVTSILQTRLTSLKLILYLFRVVMSIFESLTQNCFGSNIQIFKSHQSEIVEIACGCWESYLHIRYYIPSLGGRWSDWVLQVLDTDKSIPIDLCTKVARFS